jgi:hypothetical protein
MVPSSQGDARPDLSSHVWAVVAEAEAECGELAGGLGAAEGAVTGVST